MVRPNFIPRTLVGVGGVRLFDIPGVVYPKEVLVPKEGMNRRDGRPYRELPPGWGVTSREVGAMLGCTHAAARAWLRRHKVPFRFVGAEGVSLRIYWKRDRVLALKEARLPLVQDVPSTLISSREAQRILSVERSTLHRYEERGLLSVVKMRRATTRGSRLGSYFARLQVESLARRLSLVRLKEEELSRVRKQQNTTGNRLLAERYRSRREKPRREK